MSKTRQAQARRGRPRAYDPETALEQARAVFWDAGFASSSLDALSYATSMKRPSLYAAFGDKEALYLKALERYRQEGLAAMRQALDPRRPLREGLRTVYANALTTYLSGEAGQRGCFLIGTAATEAVTNAAVRGLLAESLADFDRAIEDRLTLARKTGEIAHDADVRALAYLASAVMHSLAVRARAGDSRAKLEPIARSGVDMVCRLAQPCGYARS
jgi:AcrR family transcriptional regulator